MSSILQKIDQPIQGGRSPSEYASILITLGSIVIVVLAMIGSHLR